MLYESQETSLSLEDRQKSRGNGRTIRDLIHPEAREKLLMKA